MKRFALILAFLISCIDVYGAAPARGGRNASGGGNTSTTQTARAARTSGARGNTNASTGGSKVVSRSASPVAPNSTSNTTSGKTSVGQRGRSATTPTSNTKAARAAKQNVVNTGTKVAAAAQNTVVDEECWNKFSGCMDSFCMMDNANGGRCLCSNKNSELDAILEEIQKLDNKSYQMATVGVERIEMGEDVDAVIAKTEAITKGLSGDTPDKKSRRALDLTQWNATSIDFEAEDDIFATGADDFSKKTGDALLLASYGLCTAQIPECGSQFSMMDLMYKQRVRSDCTAYENSLKQQRTQSSQKLASAEAAMREAALEQHRSANKYDLGQCTLQFKQCMQTTAGCGEDFAGCVTYDYTSAKMGNKSVKPKKIKGATTTIEIAASTYDVLDAKKPMCMGVTKECVNVRDQVWDTFLREAAPELKSAELIAESNVRTSCTKNISECFQKACKDNIDPNDPEGSYDMCLTRPDTLRSLCKVQIDPCEAAEPKIMDYVRARLASMRVDSCTKEFKQCLQSEDRCGEDYTQCIGLDTDTIVRLCPAEKLTGCQFERKGDDKVVKDAGQIYDELATVAEGIFLNIDNNMLTECQKAADTAMIKVCGSTENCDDLAVDDKAGTRAFKYQVCEYNGFNGSGNNQSPKWTGVCRESLDAISESELKQAEPKGWAGKLSGLVYWGDISYDNETNKFTSYEEYIDAVQKAAGQLDDEQKEIIKDRVFGTEIKALSTAVENAIKAIESDTKVAFCMQGRQVQGMRKSDKKGKGTGDIEMLGANGTARFPNLTQQMRQVIAISALKNARDNYMTKYDTEIERMMKDQVTAAKRLDAMAAREVAKKACEEWAKSSTLPQSKTPKASNVGSWIAVGLIAAVAVVATIFTFGALGPVAFAATAAVAVAAAGTAAGVAASIGPLGSTDQTVGTSSVDQWNFKQVVTTLFNERTGVCTKNTTTQNCNKTKKNYCEKWANPVEKTTSMNLLDGTQD